MYASFLQIFSNKSCYCWTARLNFIFVLLYAFLTEKLQIKMAFKHPKTFQLNSYTRRLIERQYLTVLNAIHLKIYPEWFAVWKVKTAMHASFWQILIKPFKNPATTEELNLIFVLLLLHAFMPENLLIKRIFKHPKAFQPNSKMGAR